MLERQLITSLIQMRDDIPNDMEFGGRVRFLLGRYLRKVNKSDYTEMDIETEFRKWLEKKEKRGK